MDTIPYIKYITIMSLFVRLVRDGRPLKNSMTFRLVWYLHPFEDFNNIRPQVISW